MPTPLQSSKDNPPATTTVSEEVPHQANPRVSHKPPHINPSAPNDGNVTPGSTPEK